jgi:hypothetical protein
MSIRFVAFLVVAASCCLAPSSANAGLFGHRAAGCGCDVAPSCCEVVVPSCGCEVSCDPCGGGRQGLLARLRAHCAAKSCCAPAPVCCEPAPVCCAPAPVCCEPAPVCCEPAPVCCDAAPVCCDAAPKCCKGPGLFAKLKARRAAKACAPVCCEVVSCGCDAGCGCGM